MAVGTLALWRKLVHSPRGSLTISTTMLTGHPIVLSVAGVVPRITTLESPEEDAQRGDIGPYYAGEDGAPRCLADDKVLKLHLEG